MKYIVVIIGFLLFLGCQNVEKPVRPENLIPEEMMADILAEAYIGNAARSNNNRILRSKGVKLDSILYKKYDVDSLQFAASNAYYASNLNGYAQLLEKVEDRLVKQKTIIDTLHKREIAESKRKRDSIKRHDSIQRADSLGLSPLRTQPVGELVDPVLDEE